MGGSSNADYRPEIDNALGQANLPKSNIAKDYSSALQGSLPGVIGMLLNTQKLGNSFIKRGSATGPQGPQGPTVNPRPALPPNPRQPGQFYPSGDPGSIPVTDPRNPNAPPIGGIPRLPVNPPFHFPMPAGSPTGSPGSPEGTYDPSDPNGHRSALTAIGNILGKLSPMGQPAGYAGGENGNPYAYFASSSGGGGGQQGFDPTGGINSGVPPVNPAPGTFGNYPGGWNYQPDRLPTSNIPIAGRPTTGPNAIGSPDNYGDLTQPWDIGGGGGSNGYGEMGDNGLTIDPWQNAGFAPNNIDTDPLGGFNANDPYYAGIEQALSRKFNQDNSDLQESFGGTGTARGTGASYAQAQQRAAQLPVLAQTLGAAQQQQIGNRLTAQGNSNSARLGLSGLNTDVSKYNAGQNNQGNLALAGMNQGAVESQIGRALQSLMTLFGGGLSLAGAGIPGGNANVNIGNGAAGNSFGSTLGGIGSLLGSLKGLFG